MKKISFFIGLLFLCTLCSAQQDQNRDSVSITDLSDSWTVKILNVSQTVANQVPSNILNEEFTTSIPTTIHLDLLAHNKIVDPFFGDNYPKVGWVAQSQVKYSKNFTLSAQELESQKVIEIIFYGIDTYADIYLNDEKIGSSENAFRKYTFKINKYAKENNVLDVIINSTFPSDQKGQRMNNMPFKYAHTRKACYQYSWDWAPELNTLGIWKNVELRVFDEIRLDYVWLRNKFLSQEEAVINFASQLTIETFKDEKLSEGYTMAIYLDDQKLGEKQITEDTVYVDVSIQNPQFWWPNGFGEPYIYDFSVRILRGDEVVDVKQVPYGIRTATLDLSNKQFKLLVNGYPIYCKGANYVPLDMFHPRITNPNYKLPNSYQKIIKDAVQSNFNMIRIWGGGQYESDQFLELASRNGIMIFYDFMFSDSVYPSTKQFLLNVEEEIKQQVRRARNYPSLVLWCGNNEILQGIQSWGWGQQRYVTDYKNLFQTLIKRVVQIENPDISYVPTSPIYGVGNYAFDKGGDFHYWGVWAGGQAFQSYRSAVGPFNSQFGTQGLPVWHTIKQFTKEEDRNYESAVFLKHQRHGSQFRQVQTYMNMYMKKSKNFEMQAYQTGVLQAFAIQIAIIAQRLAKPRCYGTLYWQLNDAWPAISWSSIDYYGRWKPLQYMAKRLYPNVAVFANQKGEIFAVSDNLFEISSALVKIKVLSFDGAVKQQKQVTTELKENQVKLVHTSLPVPQQQKSNHLIYCEIWVEQKLEMKSTAFYTKPKELSLPKATLQVSYNVQENTATFKSDKLIKNLYIDHTQRYIKLSDNYFDLVPGVPTTVSFFEEDSLSQLKSGLKYVSLRQASQSEVLDVRIN